MLKTLRRAGFSALLAIAFAAPAAQAAGPGDTLLESRPSGSGPLDPGLFAWNESMVTDEPATSPSAPAITPDGRYAVFFSQADGLAPGQDPAFSHVVRKDMQTGAVAVVDFGANASSVSGDISDDGRFVVFASRASNLTGADTTPDPDVFVKDLQNGTVTLLSPAVQGNDCLTCMQPVISGNGAEVAYVTGTAIVAGDTNNHTDVYAIARTGGLATFVSAKPGGTDSSTGTALDPSITDDGTMVAYRATGNDRDPGNDTTDDADLFTRVLANTSSKLASAQNGNDFGIAAGGVIAGQISGDGLKAVWSDSASYLAADGDMLFDIYSRTLATKVDTLISVTTGGTKGDGGSFQPATDVTGRRVAFVTLAPNLGGSASGTELAVRDTTGGTTTAITSGARASLPAVTHGSGDRVVFDAQNAISDGPTPDGVHVASVGGGGLALVSAPATGGPLVPGLVGTFPPNFAPGDARVSSDGRYVVFNSTSPGLGASLDRDSCFRRDNLTDQLLRFADDCVAPTVSGDGQRIAFLTDSQLDPIDTGSDSDIYVHDVASGANTLVTRASGAGPKADGSEGDFEISADGRRVAFVSSATNLGVASGRHVYVRDIGSGDTFIADRTTAGATTTDPAVDGAIGISGDGNRVAFGSMANLDPALDDNSGGADVYVRDLAASSTTLASRQSDADGGAKGALGSSEAGISQDGRFVMFKSSAENLVPAFAPWPVGSDSQVFIRDLTARTTTIASLAADGTVVGNSNINTAALDAAGDRIAMALYGGPGSSNMAPGVSSDRYAVIVRDLPSRANVAVIQPAALGGSSFAVDGALAPALSGDGKCLTYFARGREVFPGVSPDFDQLYMRVLGGGCPTAAAVGGGPAPVRPALSRVSMTNKRFRVGKKRTLVVAKKRRGKKVKVGTTFRFRLNVASTVTIRIDRLMKGKRVGKRCVKPKAKLRKRKNCVRALKRGTLTRKSLAVGARRVAFSGRIGKKKLAPGSYRATLTASAAGLKSKPVRLRFTVVP